MDRTIATSCARKVDTIRCRTKCDALIGSKLTMGSPEHQEIWRSCASGDDVLRVTLCPARVKLDVITRPGWDVLICNAAITEPPHLVAGWPDGSDGPKGTAPPSVPAARPVGRPLRPRAL